MTIAQAFPMKPFFFFFLHSADRKCVTIVSHNLFSFLFFSNRPEPFVPIFNTTVSVASEPLWSSLLKSSTPPPLPPPQPPSGLQFFSQSCLLKPKACPLGASSCLYPPPTLLLLKTDTLLGAKVGASQAASGPFQIFQQQEPITVMRLLCSSISSSGLQSHPPPPVLRVKDGDVQSPQRNDLRLFGDDRTMIAEKRGGGNGAEQSRTRFLCS